MLRRIFVLLLFVPLFTRSQNDQQMLKRFRFTENKMGSPFNLIFYHTDSSEAVSIAKECFLIVDSLNAIFSDYIPESEVGRLAAKPALTQLNVSNELYAMISRSREAWLRSGSTFDISIGALTHLWRRANAEKKFPSESEIKKARQASGFHNLILYSRPKSISFTKTGMILDFGGIVKGYAAQRVIDHLTTRNINHALADAGGDIAMSEAPPGKTGWSVSMNLPEKQNEFWDKKLELANCAVATSGDLYHYIIHNGKKYSHIIDPRTGYGITSQRNVTIIARDGATADWLATACSILPVKKALALAKQEKAALIIAVSENKKTIVYKTPDFDTYFQKTGSPELR